MAAQDAVERVPTFAWNRCPPSVECAFHLYLLDTEAPIVRLKPVGKGDEVRLGYWSHRRRWEDIGDMGGVVLPLDKALEFIANEGVFWTWT